MGIAFIMSRLLGLACFWLFSAATILSFGNFAVGLVNTATSPNRVFTLLIPYTPVSVTLDVYFCAILSLLLAASSFGLRALLTRSKPIALADRREPDL